MLQLVLDIGLTRFLEVFELLVLPLLLEPVLEEDLFEVLVAAVIDRSLTLLVLLQCAIDRQQILYDILISALSCEMQRCVTVLIHGVVVYFVPAKYFYDGQVASEGGNVETVSFELCQGVLVGPVT